MKIMIELVDNGAILSNNDNIRQVYIEEDRDQNDPDLDYITNLTYGIWEALGYYGSKHHKERLFIKREKRRD